VGGVPRQQQAAASPAVAAHRSESVHGRSLHLGVLRGEIPGLEELPRVGVVLEGLRVLAGQEEELPAPPARTGGDDSRGPCRVTDLQVPRLPVLHEVLVVRKDVEDGPVVEEASVLDLGVESLTDARVGSVAPDDVLGRDLAPLAGRGLVGDHHLLVGLDDVDHGRTTSHLDRGEG
jgi:hypothetical protein